jgi:V/A-type H+-transporting ATPase subunit C
MQKTLKLAEQITNLYIIHPHIDGERMSVSGYAYSYARVMARMGDIFSEGRLKDLIAVETKDDFLSSLIDTAYKEKLAKASSTDMRNIELALKEELIDQYLMVLRSTRGKVRAFFKELFRRFEVENLKAVIIAKSTGVVTEKPLFFPVEDSFGRKMSGLMDAESVRHVILRLEDPYKRVLEDMLPEYEASEKVLILENALYQELYGAIWARMTKLGTEDRAIVRKIIGTEFDIINLTTLLRCRAAGIRESEMMEYFLPYTYSFDFNAANAKASMSAEDASTVVQLLPPSAYKEVLMDAIPEYEEQESLIPFEQALRKLFSYTIKNTLRGAPINIGTIMGFLYLKELEINNLCTISVCKENDLSAEETMKIIML